MSERPQPDDRVNIHEAKTNLSRLIERVERGAEIVIARNGRPVAKLVPIQEQFPITGIGSLQGKVGILPGFDRADDEIARDFYQGHPDDPLFQDPKEWEWPKEG
ncbi:MAG: type II toxin-antitoxin system Phd/YefM family antitoxin [Solirubrobacterales bacterium]